MQRVEICIIFRSRHLRNKDMNASYSLAVITLVALILTVNSIWADAQHTTKTSPVQQMSKMNHPSSGK